MARKIVPIVICIMTVILVGCNHKPTFTRIIIGKTMNLTRTDNTDYLEEVLVKHSPSNSMEHLKMMLSYHDSVGLPLSTLKGQPPTSAYNSVHGITPSGQKRSCPVCGIVPFISKRYNTVNRTAPTGIECYNPVSRIASKCIKMSNRW